MEKNDVAWLKPSQVEEMRDAAYAGSQGIGLRDELIITLLYDLGLRRSELAQLDTDMIDLDEEVIRLPGDIQKDYPTDGSPRHVVMELDRGDNVQLHTSRILKRYLEDHNETALISSRESSRISPKSVNLAVKRAAANAGVKPYQFTGRGTPGDISAHTLRHSVAWRLMRAEDGYSIYNVKNRLRHSSVMTTEQKYAHFDKV